MSWLTWLTPCVRNTEVLAFENLAPGFLLVKQQSFLSLPFEMIFYLLFACLVRFALSLPTPRLAELDQPSLQLGLDLRHAQEDRHATRQATGTDPRFYPNGDLGLHLNPEWSPDPNNIAPVTLDAISPWNDSGRSQMLDNFTPPPGVNCPARALDCRRCPGDIRCGVSWSTSKSTPSIGLVEGSARVRMR